MNCERFALLWSCSFNVNSVSVSVTAHRGMRLEGWNIELKNVWWRYKLWGQEEKKEKSCIKEMYGRIQDTFSCKSVKANLSFTSLRMRRGIIHTHLYIHVIIIYYYLSNYFLWLNKAQYFPKFIKAKLNTVEIKLCCIYARFSLVRKLLGNYFYNSNTEKNDFSFFPLGKSW